MGIIRDKYRIKYLCSPGCLSQNLLFYFLYLLTLVCCSSAQLVPKCYKLQKRWSIVSAGVRGKEEVKKEKKRKGEGKEEGKGEGEREGVGEGDGEVKEEECGVNVQ